MSKLESLPAIFASTYSLVERSWARTQKTKKGATPDDLVEGTIQKLARKHRAIPSSSMVMFGFPPKVAVEACLVTIPEPKTDGFDGALAAGCLYEMWRVVKEEESLMVELTEDKAVQLRDDFMQQLEERKGAGEMANYWRKIFLNCPEILIQYLADATGDK